MKSKSNSKGLSGQGLAEYALILVLVAIVIYAAVVLLTHHEEPVKTSSNEPVATSTPPALSDALLWSHAKEPVCKVIVFKDIRDIQYISVGHSGGKMTILVLNNLTPVYLNYWIKFQDGRYLYDPASPYSDIPGKYLGTEPCPPGASDLDK